MTSQNAAHPAAASVKLPIRTPFYYGWLIVVLSGIGVFFSGPGQTYSNSVFIESYILHFGMSQTEVASIYSAATLLSGSLLFLMGRATDRYGRRIMMTLAALMLGAACMFNSVITGPVMLFIGFFLVRYFGQGSLTLIPNTLVSQWFMKYRGRALSFVGIGGLLGAAAFPPLINALIDAWGWQSTWRILGIALIVFFAPLSYFLVRNRPEDAGLLPDGTGRSAGEQEEPNSSSPENAPPLPHEDSWTLKEATRTRAFWLIMICGAIPGMIITGITFQLFSILGERGVDRVTTAFLLGMIPLVSFGCSLLAGFIVERMEARKLLAFSFLMACASPLLLLVSDHYALVLAFAVVWGMSQGFMNVPLGVLWPNYFGRKHLGSIQGVTHTAVVIGSALGPIQFGWAYDQFGHYDGVLLVSSAVWAAGAVLAILAIPPRRQRVSP